MPNYTPVQDGQVVLADSSWDGTQTALFPATVAGVSFEAGLRFTLHSNFNAGNLPIDPPILQSAQLNITITAAQILTFSVRVVNRSDPQPWTSILRPGSDFESSGVVVLGSRFPEDQEVEVATHTTLGTEVGVALQIPLDVGLINAAIGKGVWNGDVSLVIFSPGGGLQLSIEAVESATDPVLVTVEVPFRSGIRADHLTFNDRAVPCSRCGGMFLEREELVKDGFRRGLDVCSKCWDPPDIPFRPLRGIRMGNVGSG